MAKETIRVGDTANDKKGDSLRVAFQKVNANFTELYVALGLDSGGLNLGAFEFTGSTISTTDSSSILIDQATTISSNLNVGGDILPISANGGDLGSASMPWKSLYVSKSTIYLGGIPLGLDNSNNLIINGSNISQSVFPSQSGNNGKYLTTDGNGNLSWGTISSGITASSSDTFTNKTINIAFGQGNTFQIQGNSITSYSGSGSIVALTTLPTLYGMNVGNSSLTVDGGTGNYYWKPTTADGSGTIHKAGIYKSNSDANNSLFTLGANGSGVMSLQLDGSVFVGSTLPSNNGGLNTDYGGWLVVQSGGKFGGDINTLGKFILDSAINGAIVFPDNSQQTTAYPGIPGPYTDDSAAATAGVAVGKPYYQVSGQVFVRLV